MWLPLAVAQVTLLWSSAPVAGARPVVPVGHDAVPDPDCEVHNRMVDKQAVHEDFDQVRSEFRALLHDATDEELRRRSSGTRWNNRQLLFHMLLGFLIMRALLALARIMLGCQARSAAAGRGCSTRAPSLSTQSTSSAPGSAAASCLAER